MILTSQFDSCVIQIPSDDAETKTETLIHIQRCEFDFFRIYSALLKFNEINLRRAGPELARFFLGRYAPTDQNSQ